ncbi:MAG: type II CRISPR-associated endonuclease Cas1 [Fimbriimonadales bacterium]|nr:type II CRISPR-associated endonuclease Cas1 [Fimbriimonadales bacterium]
MSHRYLEIEGPCRVSVHLGLLEVSRPSSQPETFPCGDLAVLVLHGPGIELAGEAVQRLAAENVALVWCDAKRLPCFLALPVAAHPQHSKVLRQQIAAALPTQKRVWQSLVQAKLRNQAIVLERIGGSSRRKTASRLRELASLVRSGAPDNVEGVGAQLYWPSLFGEGFVRDTDQPGLNAALNYAYAVLRACVARAIVGAGLHPALGVFHRNQFNSFALADDAMEPLRPWVDLSVAENARLFHGEEGLSPRSKRALLSFFLRRIRYQGKMVAFTAMLPDYAAALRQVLCREKLKLPTPEIPVGEDSEPCGSS